MTEQDQAEQLDGRRLRSERSKRAIIDACVTLVNEGMLVPTAQKVSDQAGVPIRTFFRHFPDMETLFKSMDDELRDLYKGTLFSNVATGTLRERVACAVDLQAESFELNRGITESSKAQLWRYEILQVNYARWQKDIRTDRELRLPELKKMDSAVQELVNGVGSYEMWNRLRVHQKLSVKKSSEMIKNLIYTLLKDGLKTK